ncbi:hypothetical protein OHB49_43585 (plasmid) [Streptomyces sp. NBC_01717]|uniref:hypothetical protein n=1 Tax=Streptomyces sp. NBC_01717 TaxID=2975918 RepID=UPI002E3573C0|nr:hypothetical protein [Streptomyces sp. NBC_01717]
MGAPLLALAEAAAASGDTHVAVRVRPQTGLIKIRFFVPQSEDREVADLAFTTVFDGSLLLLDGCIGGVDVEQSTRYVYRVGNRSEFKVRVAVDSPGADDQASDVTITRSIT